MKVEKTSNEKELPLVTIMIPTYNQEEYIGDAIQSAIDQAYGNKEIIVLDDASTDKTASIANVFADRYDFVRLVSYKENVGRVNNYHLGLYEHARGEFVINLDGDDFFVDDDYVLDAIQLISQDDQIVAVFANKVSFVEGGGEFKDYNNSSLPQIIDGNWLFLNYPKGFSIAHMTTLYRRNEAMAIDYYRKDLASADWESVLRLIPGKKVGYIDRHVGMWRLHGGNESMDRKINKIISNASFAESVVEYVKGLGYFTEKEMDDWKSAMLERYFLKHLVKSMYFGELSSELLAAIKNKYPDFYVHFTSSLKFKLIKMLGRSRFLLKLVLRIFVKNNSFLSTT